MFIDFGNTKCPVCGTNGRADDENIFSCPRCSTAYTSYGIVVTSTSEKEMELN